MKVCTVEGCGRKHKARGVGLPGVVLAAVIESVEAQVEFTFEAAP